MEFEPKIDQGVLVSVRIGKAVTEEELASLPKTMLVSKFSAKSFRGDVPHFLGPALGEFYVSERVKDLIEELEPGTHDYAPFQTKSKGGLKIGGKTEHGTYYLILKFPQLNALVVEKTEFKYGIGRAGFEQEPALGSPDSPCVLDPEVTAGHHFWRLTPPFRSTYIISDEFHDRLKSEDLGGWSINRSCTYDAG